MMAQKPSNIAATKAADPLATVSNADTDTAATETADPQTTVNKADADTADTETVDPLATVNKVHTDTADIETVDPQATVNKADEVIRVRTVDGGGDYYRGGIKFTQNWQVLNINDIANPNDWQRIKTDPLLEIQKGDGS